LVIAGGATAPAWIVIGGAAVAGAGFAFVTKGALESSTAALARGIYEAKQDIEGQINFDLQGENYERPEIGVLNDQGDKLEVETNNNQLPELTFSTTSPDRTDQQYAEDLVKHLSPQGSSEDGGIDVGTKILIDSGSGSVSAWDYFDDAVGWDIDTELEISLDLDQHGRIIVTNDHGVSSSLIPSDTQVTKNNGDTFNLSKVINMITLRDVKIGKFLGSIKKNYTTYYQDEVGKLAFTNALANVAVRLAQGEDFDDIMVDVTAQLLLKPQVNALLTEMLEGSSLENPASGSYESYMKDALSAFIAQAIINGGEDLAGAAENITLTYTVSSIIANNGNSILSANGSMTTAGAGLAAAVISLGSNVLNGDDIGEEQIAQAGIAGATAMSAQALAAAVAGKGSSVASLFGVTSAAGPAAIVIGAAIGMAIAQLLKPKVYHDETVSHKVEDNGDGTVSITGLRNTGSLLRTVGNTNDDFFGNDSADDSTGHDVIVGQSGANEIYARGGHDFIEGRSNNDYIEAGTGDDHVEAGDGADYVEGNAGNDKIYGQFGDDNILGGSGQDIILGGAGEDNIEGNDDDDDLYGGDDDDTVAGGAGDDLIDGGRGSDTLLGEDGEDVIDGGAGEDIIEGGNNADLVFGGSGNDSIRGDGGNDTLFGEEGIDTLYGGAGNDAIDGGNNADILFGGIGSDMLHGSYGDDSLNGEIGTDLLVGGYGVDTIDGGDGDDVFLYSKGHGRDTITDIAGLNTLKFTDINHADIASINQVGNDLVITIDADNTITVTDHFLNAGLETIELADGQAIDVSAITFDGGGVGSWVLIAGSNVLNSVSEQYQSYQKVTNPLQASTAITTGWLLDNYDTQVTSAAYDNEIYNDVQVRTWHKSSGWFSLKKSMGYYDYHEKHLTGGASADRIVGMWWAETTNGAVNNDQLYGNGGADIIHGGLDHDIIFGGADNDTIYSENGSDKIFGGTGDDTVEGGAGNDTIYGEWGADTLSGQDGDDLIEGGFSADVIDGGSGNDILYGDDGDDTVTGGTGDDFIAGGQGVDTVQGGAGDDLIFGEDGNDDLSGDAGNDTIVAGAGNDAIDGGAGNDVAVFEANSSDYAVTFNADHSITVIDQRTGSPEGTDTLQNIETLRFADAEFSIASLSAEAGNLQIEEGESFTGALNAAVGATVSIESVPAFGSFILNGDGTYTYTAPSGTTGSTTFKYRVVPTEGLERVHEIPVIVGDSSNFVSNTSNNTFVSANGADVLTGGVGNDIFQAGAGNDTITGGEGNDVSVYNGNASDYIASFIGSTITLVDNRAGSPNGTDTLTDIETLRFSDGDIQVSDISTVANDFQVGQGEIYNGQIEVQAGDVVSIESAPTFGTLVVNGDGSYSYTAPTSLSGTTSFTYRVTPTNGLTRTYEIPLMVHAAGIGSGDFTPDSESEVSTQVTTNPFGNWQGTLYAPRTVALADGGYAVIWPSFQEPDDTSGYGMYAQIHNADGTVRTARWRVNDYTANYQVEAGVTATNDGGFYLVWSSYGQDGSSYGVYMRKYNANGVAQTSEIQISDTTYHEQIQPEITELTNGHLAVTWTRYVDNSVRYNVYTRIFDASGVAQTGEILATTYTAWHQKIPDITALQNGGYVITWESNLNDGSNEGIFAQRFDASGNKVGPEFQVNSYTSSTQYLPYIETLSNGNFIVSWTSHSHQDGSYGGVYAQLYAEDGTAIGSEFRINEYTQDTQSLGRIVALPDGGAFITWSSHRQDTGSNVFGDYGVYGKRFDANMNGIGSEFRINDTIVGGQWLSDVVLLASGDLMLVWSDVGSGKVMSKRLVSPGIGAQNIVGGSTDDILVSGDGDDVLEGADGDDILQGGSGNDNLDGGAGEDIATFSGNLSDYLITLSNGTLQISDQRAGTPDGIDTLQDIETLNFADGNVAVSSLLPESGNLQISQGADFIGNLKENAGDVVSIESAPAFGTFVLNGDGTYTYTAPSDAHGSTSFKYRITPVSGPVRIYEVPVSVAIGGIAITDYTANAEVAVGGQNPSGDGLHYSPHITTLTDGGYVITWSSYQDVNDSNLQGVYAQVHNADGSVRTAKQLINNYTHSAQLDAAVTSTNDGGFVVTWTSYGQDGSADGVFMRKYNATGIPQTSDIQINSTTLSTQMIADVAELTNGNLAVTWSSLVAGTYDVYTRIFDSVGAPVTNEFLTNTHTSDNQLYTAITELQNGGFVVTWQSAGAQDGSEDGIFAQRFDANGVKVGSEFQVNTYTNSIQYHPHIETLANGNFIISWTSHSWQDGSGGGVYAQAFAEDGTPVGSEFKVNETTADTQQFGRLTALPDGGVFVTWSSHRQDGPYTSGDYGIYGKRFDANMNSVGSEMLINDTTTGNQWYSDVTLLPNGDLMLVWSDVSQGQIMSKRLVAPAAAGDQSFAGTEDDDILSSGEGNDTLVGGNGSDILQGNLGNDTLSGGAGNDKYIFKVGDGSDVIDNNDDGNGTDTMSFTGDVERHDLWFSRSGYDLVVDNLNNTDQVKFQNWFVDDNQKVDEFTSADGYTLDATAVDQLINAMAAFDPTGIGSVDVLADLPESIRTQITANWQS
jgi:Ca2+-binding RTX toxin-like protein